MILLVLILSGTLCLAGFYSRRCSTPKMSRRRVELCPVASVASWVLSEPPRSGGSSTWCLSREV